MTKRVCVDCMATIDAGRSRCAECAQVRDRARGLPDERGYGYQHRRLRGEYQRAMDAGQRYSCWRCNDVIDPSAWHLGHDDHDRSRHRGPECIGCNTATAGRR